MAVVSAFSHVLPIRRGRGQAHILVDQPKLKLGSAPQVSDRKGASKLTHRRNGRRVSTTHEVHPRQAARVVQLR